MAHPVENQVSARTQPVTRRRRWALAIVLALVILPGALFAAWRLTRPSFDTIEQELDYLVTDLVKSDPKIKNTVLLVMKGDGSFTWSGAAGVARQDGQVPMTADTPIFIASVTKLYTAVAIMALYEQGRLALDDPMAKYLPEELIRGIHVYQGHDYSQEITVAQLLAHTSGIADYYNDRSQDGKSGFELFAEDQGRVWAPEELIARARDDLQPHFAPNAHQAYYSDTNYLLLGKIIESVTGKPLQDVYAELFFQPLGLTHTWLSTRSEPQVRPAAAPAEVFSNDTSVAQMRASGSYWADGGIVSTAEDAAMFLKALKEGLMTGP